MDAHKVPLLYLSSSTSAPRCQRSASSPTQPKRKPGTFTDWCGSLSEHSFFPVYGPREHGRTQMFFIPLLCWDFLVTANAHSFPYSYSLPFVVCKSMIILEKKEVVFVVVECSNVFRMHLACWASNQMSVKYFSFGKAYRCCHKSATSKQMPLRILCNIIEWNFD